MRKDSRQRDGGNDHRRRKCEVPEAREQTECRQERRRMQFGKRVHPEAVKGAERRRKQAGRKQVKPQWKQAGRKQVKPQWKQAGRMTGRELRSILRYCQGAVFLAASAFLILAACLMWGGLTPHSAGITGTEDQTGAMTESNVPAENVVPEEGTETQGSSAEPKRVALTFDDGPHPVYTGILLDGLKERQIQATFFVIGENIPGNEELIARMAEEGHVIGNHTYGHVKLSDMNAEAACAEVEKTSALVRAVTGEDTEFVRPPFGEWNKKLETAFVMIPVLWDVDPLDWTTKNTALVVQRVLDDVEDGDIILLHDCYESSVRAALQIADTLISGGWEFVTVDELILE